MLLSWKKAKTMLKKLRHIRDNGTNAQKTRWVWGLSIVSFAIIVSVWGMYKTEEFSISASFIDKDNNEPGVVAKLKKGLASVTENLSSLIKTQNTIEIENINNETKVKAFPKTN